MATANVNTSNHAKFYALSASLKDMDCIDLAFRCSNLLDLLMEEASEEQTPDVLQNVAEALTALQGALEAPLSLKHILQLTVKDPITPEAYKLTHSSEALCEYCQAITTVLQSRACPKEITKTLVGLLFDLVNYQYADLTAPRFWFSSEGLRDL